MSKLTNELMDAAFSGNIIKIFQLMAEKSIDLNVRDNYGNNALVYACINDNIEIIKLLLKNGIDVHNKNNKGNSVLIEYASSTRNINIEVLKLLFDSINLSNNSINAKNNRGSNFFAECVVSGASIDTIKYLLKLGCDPNSVDGMSDTVLMTAAYKGNLELVKLLLDNKADPNKSNDFEQNSIAYASHPDSVQNIEICKLLIEEGADIFSIDKDKDMPINKDWVREIYRQLIISKVKKAQRNQRLAFAKILIDPKYLSFPQEVVKKILLLLKSSKIGGPTLNSKPSYSRYMKGKDILSKTNELLNRALQQDLQKELQNEIRALYPGENLDNMVEFYRKQLQILTLKPEQRKELKKKKRTRKKRLGIPLGTSDLSYNSRSSRGFEHDFKSRSVYSRNSRSSRSSRKSRSLRSSEKLQKSSSKSKKGSKKKKLHKSKKKSK